MRAFQVVDGRYVAGLDGTEREVLATVVADVAGLLGADRFGASTPDPGAGAEHPLLGLRMSPVVVPAPVDPAVHRLLPDASSDDPELSAEFRRLTEGDLRAAKIDRLRALWHALVGDGGPTGDLVVRREDAADVAATLTDLRLVLADRLQIASQEDSDALYDALERRDRGDEVPDRSGREELQDEIRTYLGSLYAALGWLQESLVTQMLADLP
jgi:Domain of unknown function (DUF2017)